MMPEDGMLQRACIDPACKQLYVRKVCIVGEKLCSDQYHYDMIWLVQCDLCKTIFTVAVIG